MTNYWLCKQEPSSYSLAHLEREGSTIWDGVHNALALKHLRSMRPGDLAFFYESGEVRSIVGVMRVLSDPRRDPKDPTSFVVDMEFVRRLNHPIPLKVVKEDPKFKGFDLVRLSRLSVMPVPDEQPDSHQPENVGDPETEEEVIACESHEQRETEDEDAQVISREIEKRHASDPLPPRHPREIVSPASGPSEGRRSL